MTSEPVVSVILPTYNDEKFISEAVRSILEQSFEDFECIVVNDGSTDGTPLLLEQFATSDPRLRVINTENGGIVAALNRGLAEARGRYIARMDGDDISEPHRFERQVAFLDEKPNVVAVGCSFSAVDEGGRFIRNSKRPESVAASELYGPDVSSAWICHPASMLRRESLVQVGGYRYCQHAEDADLWLRLEEIGDLGNCPDVLFRWRRHPGRVTIKHTKVQKSWHALAMISARRRRESVDDFELSGARNLEDVLDELSDYERARYNVITGLLKYEFELHLGAGGARIRTIRGLIETYSDYDSAGFVLEYRPKGKSTVEPYAKQRIQRLISGNEWGCAKPSLLRRFIIRRLVCRSFAESAFKVISKAELRNERESSIALAVNRYRESQSKEVRAQQTAVAYCEGNRWGSCAINQVTMYQQTFNCLPDLGIVYAECSKNACTTVKRGLMLADHMRRGFLPFTGNVHFKPKTTFLGPDDLSLPVFQAMMEDSKVIRLCVSRNPYERLVSAYFDKVAGLETLQGLTRVEYFEHCREMARVVRGWEDCSEEQLCDEPIRFPEFVDFLSQTEAFDFDRHWMPQTTTMRPDLFDYSHHICFDTLSAGLMKFCSDANLPESIRHFMLKKSNSRSGAMNWKSHYNEELAERVYSIYQMDFERYGYSRLSWK